METATLGWSGVVLKPLRIPRLTSAEGARIWTLTSIGLLTGAILSSAFLWLGNTLADRQQALSRYIQEAHQLQYENLVGMVTRHSDLTNVIFNPLGLGHSKGIYSTFLTNDKGYTNNLAEFEKIAVDCGLQREFDDLMTANLLWERLADQALDERAAYLAAHFKAESRLTTAGQALEILRETLTSGPDRSAPLLNLVHTCRDALHSTLHQIEPDSLEASYRNRIGPLVGLIIAEADLMGAGGQPRRGGDPQILKVQALRLEEAVAGNGLPGNPLRRGYFDFRLEAQAHLDDLESTAASLHGSGDELAGRMQRFSAGFQAYLAAQQETLDRQTRHRALLVVGLCALLSTIFLVLARLIAGLQKAAERREARTTGELITSQKRFSDLALAAGNWLWETDNQWVLRFVAGDLQKFSAEEGRDLPGRSIFTLLPDDEAERVGNLLGMAASAKQQLVDLEHWALAADGQEYCLLTNARPILDEQDHVCGYRGVQQGHHRKHHGPGIPPTGQGGRRGRQHPARKDRLPGQ